MTPSKKAKQPLIGWREWVVLPELGGAYLKAKIDTGARTCALHAFDLQTVRRKGRLWATFAVHPLQRSVAGSIDCEAEVIEERSVRSSSGHREIRPVIRTPLLIAGVLLPVEITLAARDAMGFRMLLGRQALRRRFLIDPGRSYLSEEPGKPKRRAKRRGGRKKP